MIQKVKFDEQFLPAMKLCFGKTLICRNADFASQFSKSHDLDCVLLEGDQFSRKGTLTGGHYEARASRLSLQKSIWDMNAKLSEQEAEKVDLRNQLQELDSSITQVVSELEKIESVQMQLKETYERQKQDVKNLQKSRSSAESCLGPKESALAKSETELEGLKNSQKSLQEELGTELLSQLSEEDQQEVESLNDEMLELREKVKLVMKERTELETKKQKIEDMLNRNLYKRREALKQSLEEVNMEDKNEQLELKKVDLEDCSKNLEKSTERITELDKDMKGRKADVKKLQNSLEKWKTIEREKQTAIEEDAKNMEKIANKKSLLVKKKEECMKKIRELGSLPADAFDKYQKTPVKQLWKKLNQVNEELKKYSHVNKKALDQFVSFSEQKEKLIKRKEELDAGHESIRDLMDVLEQRKHEAILFTFKQVSTNFAEIFKKLVPNGRASLKMKKETTEQTEEEQGSSSQGQSESGSSQRSQKVYDQYSGVTITVSFSGKSAETLEMNQLSGGQKLWLHSLSFLPSKNVTLLHSTYLMRLIRPLI